MAMAFKVYPIEMRPQQWMRWLLGNDGDGDHIDSV